MKMFKIYLSDGGFVYVCKNCLEGNHISYGSDHRLGEQVDRRDCKNISDDGQHQCGCTEDWPELWDKIIKINKEKIKMENNKKFMSDFEVLNEVYNTQVPNSPAGSVGQPPGVQQQSASTVVLVKAEEPRSKGCLHVENKELNVCLSIHTGENGEACVELSNQEGNCVNIKGCKETVCQFFSQLNMALNDLNTMTSKNKY